MAKLMADRYGWVVICPMEEFPLGDPAGSSFDPIVPFRTLAQAEDFADECDKSCFHGVHTHEVVMVAAGERHARSFTKPSLV